MAPLIEGETGNDLPDNAPPSPVFPSDQPLTQSLPGELPTPSASPLTTDHPKEKPSHNTQEIPLPVNPIQQDTESIQDLGYSLYGRRRRQSHRLLESLGKVYATGSHHATVVKDGNPSPLREAVSGPSQLGWWAAIQKEYASLLEHGTWEKVPRAEVPARAQVIGCKWVFKTKAL